MFSWLFGFWSNGLHGTNFDLGSCWQGITAVVAGMTGVATLAGSQYAKYFLDSKYNSAEGEKPEKNNSFVGVGILTAGCLLYFVTNFKNKG